MTGEELFTNLEADYAARLEQRAQQWQTRHPEEAKRLREDIDRHFGKEPEPGSLVWLSREAAIVEAIRQKNGWPTMREYVRLQAGEEVAAPKYVPPKLKTPTAEREDRKAIASGERE